MKKTLILLFVLAPVFVFSEVIELRIGEISPKNGVLISTDEYNRMFEIMMIYNDTQLLEKNLIDQIDHYKQLIAIQKQQIVFLQKKFELEQAFRLEVQGKLTKSEMKIKVLSITTSVGLSLSLAELFGVGIFALMWNTMNR